jgi:hypothetical protein
MNKNIPFKDLACEIVDTLSSMEGRPNHWFLNITACIHEGAKSLASCFCSNGVGTRSFQSILQSIPSTKSKNNGGRENHGLKTPKIVCTPHKLLLHGILYELCY